MNIAASGESVSRDRTLSRLPCAYRPITGRLTPPLAFAASNRRIDDFTNPRPMRFPRPLLLALLAATSLTAQTPSAPAPDITGKWAFTVNTDAGSGTPTVTFKQQGDSISGHYSSQVLGERDFKGTFKDGKIVFAFSADVEGQQFTMSFSGVMEGVDGMKGNVDLGGMATGSFSGKRQKP